MSENPSLDKPADPYGQPARSTPDAEPSGEPSAESEAGAQPFPAYPSTPSNVPAGYDQPARPTGPGYGQPAYQQPVEQAPPPYPAQPYQQQPQYQQSPNHYQQQNQQPAYGQPYGEQKSKVAAGILGILLGGLGIHNFYLGYTKKALVQLLVSVLSFGFLYVFMQIWGLIEGILILVGNDGFRTDARGIPLKD